MSFITRSRRPPEPEGPGRDDSPTSTPGTAVGSSQAPDPTTDTTAGTAAVSPIAAAVFGDDAIPLGSHTAPRSPVRTALAWLTTVLAALLVFVTLVLPGSLDDLVPGAFLRLPLEALVGVGVLLLLPAGARRYVAPLAGLLLAVVTILALFNIGFGSFLDRTFNPMVDWPLLGDGLNVLRDSVGQSGVVAAVAGAVLLGVALVVLLPLAISRLTRVAVRHDTVAVRAIAVLIPVWLACALLGAQVVPGVQVASAGAAVAVYDRGAQVVHSIQDRYAFAAEIDVDAYAGTPDDQFLTDLRGKDVLFAFVESYGRSAVENPEYTQQISAMLADGTQRLGSAGFGSRSGYLTSSTSGGSSWLAHSTFMSGLLVNDQQRYNQLVRTDRLTLNRAFNRAGWRTLAVMPGITKEWPEGGFYGYDHIYDLPGLDYHGPNFGWGPVPDQFTMEALQRSELATPDHPPVMAEIALVSSHWPWAPLPQPVRWDEVGDGSIYNPQIAEGFTYGEVWQDQERVRTEYRRSVEYTMNTLVSYVQTYGDDDLVLVILGDHQPAPNVTGDGASHDVPISVVTRDPAVLDKVAGWGWQDGLKPGPQAPVWPMESFRDRFLTTFGSPPTGKPR